MKPMISIPFSELGQTSYTNEVLVGVELSDIPRECEYQIKILAIRNELEKGDSIVVDVIEMRTGIILRGIVITTEENPYYGEPGYEDDLEYFTHVTFSNYSEKACRSYAVSSPDDPGKTVTVGQLNFGGVILEAVLDFIKEVTELVDV